MRIRLPRIAIGTKAAVGGPSRQEVAIRSEAQRVQQQQSAQRNAQAAEYNRRLKEQMDKIREIQESADRTQAMTPPDAQDFSRGGTEGDKRVRKSSMRGSLLAGNTGGYNPATGGGRLGGRSLLG
jgi:hypothetical protein